MFQKSTEAYNTSKEELEGNGRSCESSKEPDRNTKAFGTAENQQETTEHVSDTSTNVIIMLMSETC